MHSKMERRGRSRQIRRMVVAAVCLSSVMSSGGCRSSSPGGPGWSTFGWKKEPSADALAGVGPTTTYPISPSATATPSAINSIAASPAGMQPQ
jgi:hypothetical protein